LERLRGRCGSASPATCVLSMGKTARRKKDARKPFARLRMMPDFILIGAHRCGTTSLFHYLSEHPRIVPACKKEVHFYDLRYQDGEDWYRAHFPLRILQRLSKLRDARGFLTGEASPYYLFHPAVPARVRLGSPEARLLAILRDPAERAFSHYKRMVRKGVEPLTFEQALDQEPERLAGEEEKLLTDPRYRSKRHRQYSYASRGRYAEQLERWLEHFPSEQLLVLTLEALEKDPEATMRRASAHLGLPPAAARYRVYNATGRSQMDPAVQARLTEYFVPHNHRLYELLGEDLGW
jgi:hypothetical protein